MAEDNKNVNTATSKAETDNIKENVTKSVTDVVKDAIQKVEEKKDEVTYIETNTNAKKDGQRVCPGCGASQIVFNPKTGKLKCVYCGTEFEGEKADNVVTDLKNLTGDVRGTGASDIKASENDVITLECGGCGAQVVIDTASATHARCHWCRSILTIDRKIENGAVPDVLLPFSVKKEDAEKKIREFVEKRKFFAHPKFKQEFTTNNIMGVYFPYMLVDANAHAYYKGVGEHQTRMYYVGSGDHREARYDADAYNVMRDFDITIDDLTIESNADRLNKNSKEKTNNIINAIMPFDTENCIKYESNYLVGFTSEKRDVNIDDLSSKVTSEIKDVTKFAINNDLKNYDRGVNWSEQKVEVKGKQWISAYLPVWLYSYQEVKGNEKVLHYVAVNARTLETMGSVPINLSRLYLISFIIEVIGIFLGLALASGDDDNGIFYLLFLAGFVFFGVMKSRYRNQGARHTYEKETKNEITNIKREDTFIEHRKKLKNSTIVGCNNRSIEGESVKVSKIPFVQDITDSLNKK